MKTTFAIVALVLLIPVTARAQDGRLNLDFLDKLESRASDHTNVTVDPSMLVIVGGAIPPNNPQAAAAKQLLSELKGIYVRTFEFDSDDAFTMDDLNAIRRQLSAPGWTRMVSVNEKKDKELTEIHVFQQGGKPAGFAILVAERRELVVVNIVGPIDFSKLGALGGMLGIPQLPGLGLAPPPPPPTPAPPKK
jgi:hypothetical protein